METSNPEEEIHQRIRTKGPITFAEFQSVALYSPKGGYYVKQSPFGVEGDFYTASHLHPVFGALLSLQIFQMWDNLLKSKPFWVVELGAGSGRMATDVIDSLEHVSQEFLESLRYLAVDVANRPESLHPKVQWIQTDGFPSMRFSGCVFANEFLDAMPVHRVTMIDGRLCELYVDIDKKGGFKEILGSPSTDALPERLDRLEVRLTEGYRAEINLGLESWLQGIRNSMECGYLVIIDYGHLSSIYYDDTRRTGMLRCYYHHTVNANPYINVGDQDISIHVEFSSVLYEAEKMGFKCCGYTTQSNFLGNLGLESYRIDIDRTLGYSRQIKRANLRALDTLVDPGGMGEFKVMVLSKDMPQAELKGFNSFDSGDHKGFFSKPGFAPIAGPGHLVWKHINEQEVTIASWKDMLEYGR